jgi:uncharacterized membrane protein YfhO
MLIALFIFGYVFVIFILFYVLKQIRAEKAQKRINAPGDT